MLYSHEFFEQQELMHIDPNILCTGTDAHRIQAHQALNQIGKNKSGAWYKTYNLSFIILKKEKDLASYSGPRMGSISCKAQDQKNLLQLSIKR